MLPSTLSGRSRFGVTGTAFSGLRVDGRLPEDVKCSSADSRLKHSAGGIWAVGYPGT